MPELGPSSLESPELRRPMDVPGMVAETSFSDHEMPGHETGTGSPETNATTDVQRSIEEIDIVEQRIVEHTGLTGEPLADAVDEYLVDNVEHNSGFETADTAEALDDALIEGALEATGQRPASTDNPILHLERDGFDTKITEGVKRMREQNSILPNGESAAEAVVLALDLQEAPIDQSETESAQQAKNRELLRGSKMGEQLEKAYLGAVELDPRLADIIIVAMDEGDHRDAFASAAWNKNNTSGKHETHINLNDLPASLARFEKTIEIKSNTEKIAKTLGIDPSEITPELLYVQSMIHEMGHNLEFMDYQEGGKTPDDHKHDRDAVRKTLPLGVAASSLRKHKDAVLDQWDVAAPQASKKYSAFKQTDSPITTFDGLIDATADVYRDTKFEHAADKFAADVLAQQPELMAQLVHQVIGETVDYNKESKEAGWDSPERVQKLVEQYIVPGAKVLDIGTGTGLAVQGYAEKGATVIGLDSDADMLVKAQAVVGNSGEVRQADINQILPVADLYGQVDVVQAVGVLEFANNLEKVFAEANIAQKKGGVFAFTTEAMAKSGPQSESVTNYPEAGVTVRRHSIVEITKMLHDSGYTLLSHDRYDAYQRGDGEVKYNMFLAQKA